MIFRNFRNWLRRGNAPPEDAALGGGQHLWLAGTVAFILVSGAALISPYAWMPLPGMPGLLAVYSTAMIIFSFLVSFLCLMKGLIEARSDSIRLGGAYLFTTVLMIAQLLAYPGAITPGQLAGGPATPFWLWAFWHAGFALAIIHYASAEGIPAKPNVLFSVTISVTLAYSAAAVAAALELGAVLPPIFGKGISFYQDGGWWAVPAILFMTTMLALVNVIRMKSRSPEQIWLAVGVLAAAIDIWLHWQGVARFSLGFYTAKAVSVLTSLTVLLSKLRQITRLYLESATHNKRLLAIVHKDGLTGLSNRRRFDELLAQEFNRACRNSLPLGLILIDVDWFKCYNDTYGHLAGDECLRTIAGSVSGVLKRAGDEVARYGGEEMVVLLPSTDLRGTLKIAQEMCDSVAALGISHAQSIYGKVTISAGVSVLDTFDTIGPAGLVGAADKALYKAKSEGRNRVSAMTVADLARKLCA